jgi:hypothetical protein
MGVEQHQFLCPYFSANVVDIDMLYDDIIKTC